MDTHVMTRNRLMSSGLMKAIESRNMEGHFASTKEEALEKALSIIERGSRISWGGSMTIRDIGLIQALSSGDYEIYDRGNARNAEEKRSMELAAYDCDYYLTSANALTEDGVIVNIDGIANRVSAIAAGPKNVLMVVGMNKVVRSLEEALGRAKYIAAPVNAQRFDIHTPCKKTGMCFDCKVPDTICCQTLITRYSKIPGRIKILLVNEQLGF